MPVVRLSAANLRHPREGAVAPQRGETATRVGAGAGYYSAILSMLVLAGGRVRAVEIDSRLAAAAKYNLEPFENATVIAGDAVALPMAPSDVIYVNAGVLVPAGLPARRHPHAAQAPDGTERSAPFKA